MVDTRRQATRAAEQGTWNSSSQVVHDGKSFGFFQKESRTRSSIRRGKERLGLGNKFCWSILVAEPQSRSALKSHHIYYGKRCQSSAKWLPLNNPDSSKDDFRPNSFSGKPQSWICSIFGILRAFQYKQKVPRLENPRPYHKPDNKVDRLILDEDR